MIRWIPFTFVRTSLFFIAGIILGVYKQEIIPQQASYFFFTSLVIIYLACFILFRKINRSLFNLGWIGLPAVFIAGYVHLQNQTEWRRPDHLINISQPINYYQVVLSRFVEEKESSWKVEANVQSVYADQWINNTGKIVLYFSKENYKVPFHYGDVLLIKGSPQLVLPPSNPGEFNYKRFLTFRNIYHQHFLRSDDVRFLYNDPPNNFIKYAIAARSWADQTLKKFVSGKREQAIASALVLGVVDGLDNELLNAYAATGAMHVLAVSGLHISIIYMILLWLMKPLQKSHSGQWIIALVSLFILWAYAFITGWSPSVLRAVTMFSFIALARPTRQSTNIYNTLAASAFCLLLYDPFLIMSVGFQLSYLAVLGIVYLQPGLYQLWEPKGRLWDEIWKVTCVSITAQIATFALGLLYFHQFPNYFLLSNLLVIPGSFVVLILGIVVLAVSFVSSISMMLGFLLTWSIKILNIVVFTVEAFPFSLVENIHITTFQCWLIMGAVVACILLFEYKRFSYVLVISVFGVMISLLQWQHYHEDISITKITVYNVKGHSAIDLIDHGQTYFLTDSVLLNDIQKIRFHIHPNRLTAGIQKINTEISQPFIREFKWGKLVVWNKMIIAHITQKEFVLPQRFKPDYIIIGNNAVRNISEIPNGPKIILDSSNTFSFAKRFLDQAKKINRDAYSVLHHGAFDLPIINTNT